MVSEVCLMNRGNHGCRTSGTKDWGEEPLIANMDCLARQNSDYRTALWTGKHLQVTLMSIPVCGDIGLEMHPDVDQFICIEDGCALVMMGKSKTCLNRRQRADRHCAVIIPAGTWHNIVNTGKTPLKLFSVYAPPQHPFGTVHITKEAAENAEKYE